MILLVTDQGKKVDFCNIDPEQEENLENFIVVTSGLKDIILNPVVRKSLFDSYNVDNKLYLLCPEGRDENLEKLCVSIKSFDFNPTKDNALETLDLDDEWFECFDAIEIDRRETVTNV